MIAWVVLHPLLTVFLSFLAGFVAIPLLVLILIVVVSVPHAALQQEIDRETDESTGLIKHPKSCPNCKTKGSVTYERFTRSSGKYVCDKCEWEMDAVTGEITYGGDNWRDNI